LGVGVSGPTRKRLSAKTLIAALSEGLRSGIAARAEALSSRIDPHGARMTAERLVAEYG
jgi:hypothetical protein